MERIPKRKYNISFLIMLFCIFSLTFVQYIPIYFVDTSFSVLYNFVIYVLLIISVSRTIFKLVYKPKKNNISLARLYAILVGFTTCIVFGIWTIGIVFSVWTEASTYYVRKNNSKIKIISRYINEGAFGGGTEPEDYHIVLHRPFLFFFKMETSIDTLKIEKAEWRKPDLYNLTEIKGLWHLNTGTSNETTLYFKDTTVFFKNKESAFIANYSILYDSLFIFSSKSNYHKKYKILSYSKENLMIQEGNDSIKVYYRKMK
jgi:hypothetical protein